MSLFSVISRKISKEKKQPSNSGFSFIESHSFNHKKVFYISKHPETRPTTSYTSVTQPSSQYCMKNSLKISHKTSFPKTTIKSLQLIKKKSENANLPQEKSIKKEKIKRDDEKENKMETYLRDFFFIREQNKFYPTQMVSFRKEITNDITVEYHRNLKRRKRDLEKEKVIIQKFTSNKFPEFFQAKQVPTQSNLEGFDEIILVNLGNRNYLQKPYKCKDSNFVLELKYLSQRLVKSCSSLEDSLFFCTLFSGNSRPFKKFQSFFWIGKPVRHYEKDEILKHIKFFMEKCQKEKEKSKNSNLSGRSSGYKPRIWVIDFEGRLSYVHQDDQLIKWGKKELAVNHKSKDIGQDNLYKLYKRNLNKGKFQLQKCMIVQDL